MRISDWSSDVCSSDLAAARSGDLAGVRRKLMLAIAVGSCFGIVKIIEYSDKISHGITLMTNDFFTYYYILTGVHFLHRSEEHTSELQSLMRISYAVFCLKKKKIKSKSNETYI